MDLLIFSIVGLGRGGNCVHRPVEIAIETVMSIFGFEVKNFGQSDNEHGAESECRRIFI